MVLPIIISIIALVISFLSYQTSKQSYDYGVNKDMMIYTPAIKENVDSLNILFFLNNENSELQGISITFPNDITDSPLLLNSKPVELSTFYLETMARNYLSKFVKVRDSTELFGTFAIPVMMDYSAIVYGFPQQLRENRLLVFNFNLYDDITNVTFTNSFLKGRCGYPLKMHYFYTGPFSSPLRSKIKSQDQKDVQELLMNQLEELRNSFNSNKM
jgi:hypothetical protein